MDVDKIKLKGVVYNLQDKEARDAIAKLQKPTIHPGSTDADEMSNDRDVYKAILDGTYNVGDAVYVAAYGITDNVLYGIGCIRNATEGNVKIAASLCTMDSTDSETYDGIAQVMVVWSLSRFKYARSAFISPDTDKISDNAFVVPTSKAVYDELQKMYIPISEINEICK